MHKDVNHFKFLMKQCGQFFMCMMSVERGFVAVKHELFI